ncbi:hypothetical protein Tco_0336962 [Tanacetum coccineum]
MIIVPEEGMNVEALQTKYPIINWEVYIEDSRMYWKIIRVGNHTEVELKRLFEPDDDDTLWKIQRGYDIFMLVEKDYPLTRALMTLMLCNKLQVDEYSVMADKLVDLNDNHKFRGGLLGIKGFYKFVLLVQLSTAKRRLSTVKLS